jgi:hypothetical protein
MVFIATADEQGKPDCSLRVGKAGFVHVLDSRRLAYPEYRGNGVMASVGNMLNNPSIGIVFVDFFQSTVGLHVNGKAQVLENHELAELPNVSPVMLREIKAKGGRQSVCWVTCPRNRDKTRSLATEYGMNDLNACSPISWGSGILRIVVSNLSQWYVLKR